MNDFIVFISGIAVGLVIGELITEYYKKKEKTK